MKQYQDLIRKILTQGRVKDNRTGIGTISIFGEQLRFNLQEGFPATTTKKLAWNAMVSELLWMIEGSGDERRLAEITHGDRVGTTTIWTANALMPSWKSKAKYPGDLGRVYGVQWRTWRYPKFDPPDPNAFFPNLQGFSGWGYVDQLQNLIDGLKNDPNGRRHIITAWNPAELDQMALPPCHMMAQFDVTDCKLSCLMYQRSVDTFLGLPFNIASYSLLTHMIAHLCNYTVGDFVWVGGDTHLYDNHIPQASQLLTREPYQLPILSIKRRVTDILDFKKTDFELFNYQYHPTIKAEMAV